MRVLVVDDHRESARLLAHVLTDHGYDVETAHNAEKAIALCARTLFDVIVCDIGLPDCDGWELLRRLKKIHQIRAIALSGYGGFTDMQASSAAGFEAHLTKPVDVDALLKAVRQATQDIATPGEFNR
jgi:CheY-like chemotaxis protein